MFQIRLRCLMCRDRKHISWTITTIGLKNNLKVNTYNLYMTHKGFGPQDGRRWQLVLVDGGKTPWSHFLLAIFFINFSTFGSPRFSCTKTAQENKILTQKTSFGQNESCDETPGNKGCTAQVEGLSEMAVLHPSHSVGSRQSQTLWVTQTCTH